MASQLRRAGTLRRRSTRRWHQRNAPRRRVQAAAPRLSGSRAARVADEAMQARVEAPQERSASPQDWRFDGPHHPSASVSGSHVTQAAERDARAWKEGKGRLSSNPERPSRQGLFAAWVRCNGVSEIGAHDGCESRYEDAVCVPATVLVETGPCTCSDLYRIRPRRSPPLTVIRDRKLPAARPPARSPDQD
jgi:hypothetical protein